MKRILYLSLLCCLLAVQVRAERSFALVVDEVSLREAGAELQAYAEAIQRVNGWKVVTVADRWGIPDSIRARLYALYTQTDAPLVGAVFVGDIPIPMIRDAQYLTSAFKMDQRQPRRESSVPSDRFYDDFSLSFSPLGKDDDAPYFYYTLTSASAQRLKPDLFTGRIRPTDSGGTSRYEKLRRYLRKVVVQKNAGNRLDKLFYFTGNGSLSESKVAHIDEKAGLLEHFPHLRTQPDAVSYMDYSDRPYIKEHLMNELMRPDLDLAILHHHGDWDTQYLSAIPKPRTAADALQFLLADSRARIRRSNNPDSLSRLYIQRYALADTVFANLRCPDVLHRDSLNAAMLNLTLADFAGYGFAPDCRVVVFDACYNGSFHREDCIANEYIFGSGQTVACIGGSVNVLQDKWYDRYLGLLDQGVCVGRINQYLPYLESHVIGDPTFTFATGKRTADIPAWLDGEKTNRKKMLDHALPDVQCMAMQQLYGEGLLPVQALLQRLQTSPYAQVRLQALTLLTETGGSAAVEALRIAASDPYEMIQRFAVNGIRYNGHPGLVPVLVRLLLTNNLSARVAFNVEQTLQFFPADSLLGELDRQFGATGLKRIHKEELHRQLVRKIRSNADRWPKDIARLCRGEMTDKTALRYADYLRIYCPHQCLTEIAAYVRGCRDAALQQALVHALGWHGQSWKAAEVRSMLLPLASDMQLPAAVRDEVVRTCARLK